MQISKVIGYFMIIAGCNGLGLCYSLQMRKRMVDIREMIHILDIVKSEMEYNHSTIPECCEFLARKAESSFGALFQKICDEFQRESGAGLDKICERILQEGLSEKTLKEAKDLFIQCFSDIGYSDMWLQYRNMERNRQQLQEILSTEENELKAKSKLAVSLGTMSGLLIVLILL